MKPEASSGKLKVESEKEGVEPEGSGARESAKGGEQSQKEEDVEMSDDEKAVLNLLEVSTPMDLSALKEQAGLSNKKWDKAIKGLTKNKLARVEKTEGGLLVSLM